jgi:hypothetical protein
MYGSSIYSNALTVLGLFYLLISCHSDNEIVNPRRIDGAAVLEPSILNDSLSIYPVPISVSPTERGGYNDEGRSPASKSNRI